MKKMIIVLVAGIISTALIAQQNARPVPPAPPEMKDVPLPPPPPPSFTDLQTPPPPPPAPPKPPKKYVATATNNKGYTVKIMQNGSDNIIILSKNGVVQKIKMSVWNAKPEYFESKYGTLPPPPPPAPAPPPPPPIKEEEK